MARWACGPRASTLASTAMKALQAVGGGWSVASRQPSLLSIVVPCLDEEEVLPTTVERLLRVADDLAHERGIATELVLVDDGSSDGTFDVILGLARVDARIRALRLSRNFGHQIAISAGTSHAQGDAVVVIDADLQDPPELITDMIERWQDGAKVVYGQRTRREGARIRYALSSAYYRLLDRLSEVPIPRDTGDFRLMDRSVVEILRTMPERDPYLRGMVAWVGLRQEAVHYPRAPRAAGRTKYPLRRLVSLATDGLLSFSVVPLRAAVYVGFLLSLLAVVGIVAALVQWVFTERWINGATANFIAVLFFGGIQVLFLGVIGSYLGRVYADAKQRPLFVIAEALGFEEPRSGA